MRPPLRARPGRQPAARSSSRRIRGHGGPWSSRRVSPEPRDPETEDRRQGLSVGQRTQAQRLATRCRCRLAPGERRPPRLPTAGHRRRPTRSRHSRVGRRRVPHARRPTDCDRPQRRRQPLRRQQWRPSRRGSSRARRGWAPSAVESRAVRRRVAERGPRRSRPRADRREPPSAPARSRKRAPAEGLRRPPASGSAAPGRERGRPVRSRDPVPAPALPRQVPQAPVRRPASASTRGSPDRASDRRPRAARAERGGTRADRGSRSDRASSEHRGAHTGHPARPCRRGRWCRPPAPR